MPGGEQPAGRPSGQPPEQFLSGPASRIRLQWLRSNAARITHAELPEMGAPPDLPFPARAGLDKRRLAAAGRSGWRGCGFSARVQVGPAGWADGGLFPQPHAAVARAPGAPAGHPAAHSLSLDRPNQARIPPGHAAGGGRGPAVLLDPAGRAFLWLGRDVQCLPAPFRLIPIEGPRRHRPAASARRDLFRPAVLPQQPRLWLLAAQQPHQPLEDRPRHAAR